MGWESSVERLEALLVWSGGAELASAFGLEALDGLGISPEATSGQDGWRTFSHPKNLGLLPSLAGPGVCQHLGDTGRQGLWTVCPPSFSGRVTPQNISLSEKDRYHFTSSLNSFMPLARRHGPPPAGRLFSSALNAGGPWCICHHFLLGNFSNIPACIN